MKSMYTTIIQEKLENEILQSVSNNIDCKIIRRKEKGHFNFWLEFNFKSLSVDEIKKILKSLNLRENEIKDLILDYYNKKASIITFNLFHATDLLKKILDIKDNVIFNENVFIDITDEEETLLYILYINKD